MLRNEPSYWNYQVEIAKGIAQDAHAGQTRMDGKEPYIKHPERVAEAMGGDLKATCCAWLHDVLEDTDVTPHTLLSQGVDWEVLGYVMALTHTSWEDQEYYQAKVKHAPYTVRKVKVADMLDNLLSSPTKAQVEKYWQFLSYLVR